MLSVDKNISILNNSLQDSLNSLVEATNIVNTTLQSEISEYQDIIQQIQCIKQCGFNVVNGLCVQVDCTIIGQQNINGVCQCVVKNSIVAGGACVCPANSIIINNTCICQITGQIMLNGQCQCPTTGAFVIDGICTCGINSLNISNTCSCPINSTLQGGQCICNAINGQIIYQGSCQCSQNYYIFNDSCLVDYVINSTLVCFQPMLITQINLLKITNKISNMGNFYKGYVFSEQKVLQNAFIDISDNVYSQTVIPLFQSQSTFNNIKIQIGQQNVSQGQMLSNSNKITIRQLHIVSKRSSQIYVQQYFYVFQVSTNCMNITNFILNLNISHSIGNVTLVQNISGVADIYNYEILGQYYSSSTVSLIGLYVDNTNLNITNLNFMPINFNVGNYSSYFVSQVIQSQIIFARIAIILGQSDKAQIFNEIDSNWSNQFKFGCFITDSNSTSLRIQNIIYDCYQQYNTNYMIYAGQILGVVKNGLIYIDNVCFQQYASNTASMVQYFALIATTDQNISVHNSIITQTIVGYQYVFGIIGYCGGQQSDITNLQTTLNMIGTQAYGFLSPLFGQQYAKNCNITNIIINNSNVYSYTNAGGIIGVNCRSNVTIQNTTVQNSNFTCQNLGISSLIGYSVNSTINMNNSIVQRNIITGLTKFGIVVGFNDINNIFNIVSSQSIENYINDQTSLTQIQTNCSSLTNNWSATQCE
ncbi:Conserved_hypothetical protein [Hexamita inflata]|uniref:Uncharacterized protein n=1 Tax=Hexamita inflata TaxID=28002 RepID=A0AA86TVZ2_9EUKA|nr:Conserved hypothetical protein [Hexamita inflata]